MNVIPGGSDRISKDVRQGQPRDSIFGSFNQIPQHP